MNNKELVNAISVKVDLPVKDVQKNMANLSRLIGETLEDGDILTIPNFGNFEVKKKLERIVVNPGTRQRMLVPPKLVLSFKPAQTLKNKMK